MSRGALAALAAASVLTGCGSSAPSSPAPTKTPANSAANDQKDRRSIERQVNKQVDDRTSTAAVQNGTFVQSDTTCVKQSDTAYKCLTTFISPPNQAQVATDVTCDRSGAGCISESR